MIHYMTPTIYISTARRKDSTDADAVLAASKPGGNYHQLKALHPEGETAYGAWLDGSEESYAIPTPHLSREQAVALADRLGTRFNQKQVGVFIPDPHAAGRRVIYRNFTHEKAATPTHVRSHLGDQFFTLTRHGLHLLSDGRSVPQAIDGVFPEVADGQVIWRNRGEHYPANPEYRDDIRPIEGDVD